MHMYDMMLLFTYFGDDFYEKKKISPDYYLKLNRRIIWLRE